MRSTTWMMFAPGCRWMLTMTAGDPFIQAACRAFSVSSMTLATSWSTDGRAVAVRHDRALVVLAREQLVVGIDRVGLLRSVEAALGLVDVGLRRWRCGCPRGRCRTRRARSGLAWMRTAGFWPPLMRHEADARKLRDLLRESRVGEVLDAARAAASRTSAPSVRIGASAGFDLAVDGRIRAGRAGESVPRRIDRRPAPAARRRRCSGPARTAA